MEDSANIELEQRSNILRLELKAWEKTFAAANDGKKASRDDIKQNPDIAAKYKEYNRTRDILSGKIPQEPELPKQQTPRKRKRVEISEHEVPKRQQIAKTPSRGPIQPWEVDPYDSPSVVRNLFTPSKKALGPTPQKDGMVMGLFDLLQEDGKTPSKGNAISFTSIQATPRKSGSQEIDTLKHSRTPASVGKRFMLDAFATPLKNRTSNQNGGKTPSSVSKLHFGTPSFLRRDSQRTQLPTVNEDHDGAQLSPQMARVPRKPLVRGLSSMLAGLRKMEDEAYDDDEEAMREMEMEDSGETKPKPKVPRISMPEAEILVADSQPGFPLGGFDDEAQLDSDEEEVKNPTLGRDGLPLKVYKKKGQKRTTRRVNMKPTRSKPQPSLPTNPSASDDELAESAIPDTQILDNADFEPGELAGRNFDSDSQSEYTASEGGTRYKRPDQSKKVKRMGKDGNIRTTARKVTALASQNFKRLKLRNSGAKGGVAHNSRFRRKK